MEPARLYEEHDLRVFRLVLAAGDEAMRAIAAFAAGHDLHELDLLQHVSIRVPCEACGQFYGVSLRQIVLSQQMLHLGCPVDDACPSLTYAALANAATLRELERSWSRVLTQVRALGLEIVVTRPVLSH